MLPTTTPEGEGGGGGGSRSGSKQLTVFSESKTLLGFYEEVCERAKFWCYVRSRRENVPVERWRRRHRRKRRGGGGTCTPRVSFCRYSSGTTLYALM